MHDSWYHIPFLAIQLLQQESLFFLDASMHLYKRLCPSFGPSVRLSDRPSVRPHRAKIAEKGLIHVIYIKYTLYRGFVSPFFCPSIRQSVGPSIGPFVGPSAGWVHRCLPVRLVSS